MKSSKKPQPSHQKPQPEKPQPGRVTPRSPSKSRPLSRSSPSPSTSTGVARLGCRFASPTLLPSYDRHGYKSIVGFSSHAVLKRMSMSVVIASKLFCMDGGSQEALRLCWEYAYKAESWDDARKIIVKKDRL